MQAVLAEIPKTPEQWARWAWSHRLSHDAIIAAATAAGRPLTNYIVEPINWQAPDIFLQANSQLHLDMCAATGLQSVNLQDVNLKDDRQLVGWIWSHLLEHRDVEAALGVSS